MQRFKGVASGKQSFREHCATKWLLEANPRNISASKISRYTVFNEMLLECVENCNYSVDQLEMSISGDLYAGNNTVKTLRTRI